jgi:hypothetical protein
MEEGVRRGSALVGAALTLIGFVLTQSIWKSVIEPIQEQRRLIGEVAHALAIYAYVQDGRLEEVEETRRALRSLSERLWASLLSIPFYDAFALVGLVPKATDVISVATELEVWSYTLASSSADDSFMRSRDAIAQKLGIPGTRVTRGLDADL